MKKYKLILKTWYNWVKNNINKIIIIAFIHTCLFLILKLPYINLINIYLSIIPYIIDIVLVLVLFKPEKVLLLKIGLVLFLFDFFLFFLDLQNLLEFLGIISYIFFMTYILLSLKEIRE